MPLKVLAILVMFSFISSGWTNDSFADSQRDEQGDEWNPVSAGPITTWTAPLCGKGKFVVQPFFFYNSTRGTFNPKGHFDSLSDADSKYQFQQQLFIQYGISDRLEIDWQILYQQNFAKQGGLKADSSGIGDTYLFLRYCLLEDNGWCPHITGLVQVKAPTGKFQHADPAKLGTDLMGATSGGGSWDHGCGILLTQKIRPFLIHIDAIYSFPQEVRGDGVETTYGNYLNYDFGIEYFLPRGFNLVLEFNGFLQGDMARAGAHIRDSRVKYLAVAPAIGWSNDSIQMLLAYQRTLSGTNTDANNSVVFTFVYTF